ncbi:MAG: hypothetical protein H6742_04955 [Alphaproteobacteria bacterium]|nr:hypothetical protein [Alphaproteobacteria bacterium]
MSDERPVGPARPSHGAGTPLVRGLLSLFVVWHLVSMGASLTKKTAPGAAVRIVTGPYEKALGIWQSWGMFGPNPPLGTSWLKVDGLRDDGSTVVLEPLVGEKDFDRTDLTYSRVQKVERNMFDAKKQSLRDGFAAWHCRRDPGLVTVVIRKERHMTPKPGQRETPGEVRDVELSRHDCAELR